MKFYIIHSSDIKLLNEKLKLTYISDFCTGPFLADNLKFENEFPVAYGTRLTVSCDLGLRLVGNQEVVCNKYYDYIFNIRPSCEDPS